ncbi:hypothetical protein Lcho_0953 [Leptothrix cholodnii SP-6]|uniref:Uncharacterized protein n=1 Tax=Leptothrix cholodnii (strain ATCC 51168 / LMG 8142 / SP-6) TaxID=395495 RepID=B1Y2K9_LEPCP|nr:hypothetical protein [Leptothrix cholodnii]ACB33225.1 hypothetical protein Lcho_0953 [Leptothrix cholodnii SP-6]
MDFADFKFGACVDWVEVRFDVPDPATRRDIEKKFGTGSHAKPLDANEEGYAHAFIVRIQDPARWADVRQKLDSVRARSVAATGIEIAFDAYARNPEAGAAKLPELCAHMLKGSRTPYIDARFMKGGKGTTRTFPRDFAGSIKLFSEDYLLYLGKLDSSHTQRIYFKTTDKNGKIKLPIKSQRARFENTYLGVSLNGVMSGSLREIIGDTDFSFREVEYIDDKAMLNQILRDSPRINASGRRRTEVGYREHPLNTKADSALNDRARDALRRLAKSWAAQDPLQKSGFSDFGPVALSH